MKIGIISDSHRKVKKAKKAVKMLLENGAEFFIHAGDIVEPEMLDILEASQKKYIAVYGNNDEHLKEYHDKYHLVQEPYYFKIANTKCKLMHLPFYMNNDAELIIFGHTHKFKAEFVEGSLFLNPGEICARKKPISECVLLEIVDEQFIVNYYTREQGEKNYTLTKTLSFERQKS